MVEPRNDYDSLFRPKSVAVIGASERRLTVGHRIVRNLINMKFNGNIYPVNPKASVIQGLPAFQSIKDIPQDVELAHIIVKSSHVPAILRDCVTKGVKIAIINTAGFKEIGGQGAVLEKEIVKITESENIRVFGPNCQGIINADPDVNAYCNFTFTQPNPGYISIFSQSGGVGEIINNRLCSLGEGMRMYASIGNSCDIQCHEILQYWGDDPDTKVIICHMESIQNPSKFEQVTKDVLRKKPILWLFAGRTANGVRAVKSHTGSTENSVIQNKSELSTGTLLFTGVEEACQTARAFVHLPLPKGKNVGIITNTGGAGVIAADELTENNCNLPELSQSTIKLLKETLHPEAIIANPVDVLATAGPEHFETTLSAMIADLNFDSIVLCLITPFFVDCEEVARRVVKVIESSDKPVVCVVMTDKKQWAPTLNIFSHSDIPVYDYPETGARVLADLIKYSFKKDL